MSYIPVYIDRAHTLRIPLLGLDTSNIPRLEGMRVHVASSQLVLVTAETLESKPRKYISRKSQFKAASIIRRLGYLIQRQPQCHPGRDQSSAHAADSP